MRRASLVLAAVSLLVFVSGAAVAADRHRPGPSPHESYHTAHGHHGHPGDFGHHSSHHGYRNGHHDFHGRPPVIVRPAWPYYPPVYSPYYVHPGVRYGHPGCGPHQGFYYRTPGFGFSFSF